MFFITLTIRVIILQGMNFVSKIKCKITFNRNIYIIKCIKLIYYNNF